MKKSRVLVGFVAMIVLFSHTVVVSAAAYDSSFFSSNDILFYNPNDCSPDNVAALNGTLPQIDGNDNLEKILRFFTGKGLSLAAAAGIAGNLKQESGWNPAMIQGGKIAPDNYQPVNGVGFGLAQWTFTSRQKPLVEFAQKNNVKITDLTLQLNYMWSELTGSYKTSTLDRMLAEKTDPAKAAWIFHKYYEGSADTEEMVRNGRGKPAVAIYEKYKTTISDGGSVAVDSNSTTTGESPTNQTSTTPSVKTIAIGNIPADGAGLSVAATLYGGEYSSSGWKPSNSIQGGGSDDNGMGYDGIALPGTVSYAELGNGKAFGDLPRYTKLLIVYKGRQVVAEKRDIGGGGAAIEGKPRSIDLWWETARMLDLKDSAVVTVWAVDPSTPLTPFSTSVLPQNNTPVASPNNNLACGGGSGSTNTGSGNTSGASFVTKDGFAVYSQFDPRWATVSIKRDTGAMTTFAQSGCGPTSMAMIINKLTGQPVDMNKLAQQASELRVITNGGGYHNMSTKLGPLYGLKSSNIPGDVASISSALRSGAMVHVAGQGGSPFTSGGHFVMLRGITADGKWLVGDSNGNKGRINSDKTEGWDPSVIMQSANRSSFYAVTKG